MEYLQAFAAARLPPGLLEHLTTHSSTYWSVYQQMLAIQYTFRARFVQPIYNNVLAPLLGRLVASPDIASVLLLGILFVVSIQFFNLAVRAVLFWIRLAFRIIFWGTLLTVAVWLYQRGTSGAADDVGVVQDIWKREYRYWQQQEDAARRGRMFG